MSLKIRSTVIMVAVCAWSVSPARAAESDASEASEVADVASAECVRAYEKAQEQRHHGKLLDASTQLQACARDACPAFIRKDCAAWYGEVQAEIPTVVFTARSAGRDLTDVRVLLGTRELASRIDGQAVELDPGEYDFEFKAPGMKPLTQHVLISRGERNRLQRAELLPLSAPAEADHSAARVPPRFERSWLLPGVFGTLGVLGLSSFAVFGVWGHSAESKLETSCAPDCSQSQIANVRTKYTIADVSLGVGVASLGLATYFALRSAPEPQAAHASPFDLRASSHGLSATYQGAF